MENLDVQTFKLIADPVIQVFASIVAAGTANTMFTQALKLRLFRFIPVKGNERLVTALNAVVATLVALYVSPLQLVVTSLWQIPAVFIGVVITSMTVYDKFHESKPQRIVVRRK